jgi:C4-dicarboxylate-specific signal transduction histidine kinase
VTHTPSRSWLLALGLLAASAGLCWSAFSALRAERLRHAQAEDGARLLLAQKIAADAQRALEDLRRAAELLASEASIRALLAAPTAAERQLGAERLAAAATRLGATSIRCARRRRPLAACRR